MCEVGLVGFVGQQGTCVGSSDIFRTIANGLEDIGIATFVLVGDVWGGTLGRGGIHAMMTTGRGERGGMGMGVFLFGGIEGERNQEFTSGIGGFWLIAGGCRVTVAVGAGWQEEVVC